MTDRTDRLDEADLLTPPPLRPLPHDLRHSLRQEFMHQIRLDSRPSAAPARARTWALRPAFALPVVAVLAVAAVLTANAVHHGGRNAAVNARAALVLERVAHTASLSPELTVGPGQYIFTEQKVRARGKRGAADPPADELMLLRTWTTADGARGWVSDKGQSEAVDDEYSVQGSGLYSYDSMRRLPTNPGDLLAQIREDSKDAGASPDQEAFVVIGDLVRRGYPLPKLNAALFRAAAKLPGVTVIDSAVDATGRPGIAVARVDETNGSRSEWIFTKDDYRYLGERRTDRAGKLIDRTAHLRTAVVGGLRQLP